MRYSSPSNTKQMTPKQAMFFMPVFAVIGILLTIFWGIPTARNAMESKNWPSADGRITISDVSENYDSDDGSITYTAKVAYNYSVNSLPYTGSTVAFGDYGSSDPSHAGGIVSRYPVEKNVKVYYDPGDPKTSVLEPGSGWSSFMGLIVGIAFAIIGVVGFIFARKKYRNEKTMPPPITAVPPQQPQSDAPPQQYQ